MKRLTQKSLSELQMQPEVFIPSEYAKQRGSWGVIAEVLDENGEPDLDSQLHVVPLFGRNHVLAESCWCSPQREHYNGKDGPFCLGHNVQQ